MYVQTTLDVHKKYNALVMSAFNNDAGFVAALDKVSVNSLWAHRPSTKRGKSVFRQVFLLCLNGQYYPGEIQDFTSSESSETQQ